MLKIIQARLQQYVSQELPDVLVRKGRGTRDQIANILWIVEKAWELKKKKKKKKSTSVSVTILKHLTLWITVNCGKF